ncbi:MAG TPA: hypothetical protein VI699_08830 [Candidatus Acidoferrales bacterium]|nr:hypothetical protein [Candidatus Acidoferrales bacterium]
MSNYKFQISNGKKEEDLTQRSQRHRGHREEERREKSKFAAEAKGTQRKKEEGGEILRPG